MKRLYLKAVIICFYAMGTGPRAQEARCSLHGRVRNVSKPLTAHRTVWSSGSSQSFM